MDIRITTTDARIGIETIPARLERKVIRPGWRLNKNKLYWK